MKRIIFLNMFMAISPIIIAHQNYQGGVLLNNDCVFSENTKGRTSGYTGLVETGYSFGFGNYGMNNWDLNVINGYKFNPCFSLGLGIGYRYYYKKEYDPNFNTEVKSWYGMVPIFLDFRTALTKKDVSPCLSLGLGYSFGGRPNEIMEIGHVGFFLNGAAGLRFKLSDKTALTTGIVYTLQRVDAGFYGNNHSGNSYYGTEDVTMNSLGISLGISF